MAMISLLSFSIGALLSMRWNVFVIFPVIGAALVIVVVVGVARGDSAGWLAVEMAVIIVSLELGYAARLVVYVLADAIRALTAMVVGSLKAIQNRVHSVIRHSCLGGRYRTMSGPTQCAVRNTDQEANDRTPTVTEPRLVTAVASDDGTRRTCHSDDMTAMGCLVRITTPHPQGQGRPTSTTYVVAEHDFAIAIAILGWKIPPGGQTENLGAVIDSHVKRLGLAPGGYVEV